MCLDLPFDELAWKNISSFVTHRFLFQVQVLHEVIINAILTFILFQEPVLKRQDLRRLLEWEDSPRECLYHLEKVCSCL